MSWVVQDFVHPQYCIGSTFLTLQKAQCHCVPAFTAPVAEFKKVEALAAPFRAVASTKQLLAGALLFVRPVFSPASHFKYLI